MEVIKYKKIISINDFINKDIAIHINNKEEQDELFSVLEKKGITIRDGSRNRSYKDYGKELCHNIEEGYSDNILKYGNVEWYNDNNYTICEFKDIEIV